MNFKELREANLSKAQIKKVHDKADDLPKNDFIKRYGKDGDSVRFATATNIIKKQLGVEDYEEGFKSDAQRKAAFASGYKEKGKNKKEELDKEDEKSVGRVIKQLKKAVKAHQGQVDALAKDIKDEVEITEAVSAALVNQIKRMTDRNNHFGVRIELARIAGDKELMQHYASLEKMHNKLGGVIGNSAIEVRQKLESVLKNRLQRKFNDKDADRLMGAL